MEFDIQFLFNVVVGVFSIIGVIGGIPKIWQYFKQKPHLVITEALLTEASGFGFGKFRIQFKVENRKEWWRRNGDATALVGEYCLIDKNNNQLSVMSDDKITARLVVGKKVEENVLPDYSLTKEGNPYLVIIRVSCQEGTETKREIRYDITWQH